MYPPPPWVCDKESDAHAVVKPTHPPDAVLYRTCTGFDKCLADSGPKKRIPYRGAPSEKRQIDGRLSDTGQRVCGDSLDELRTIVADITHGRSHRSDLQFRDRLRRRWCQQRSGFATVCVEPGIPA